MVRVNARRRLVQLLGAAAQRSAARIAARTGITFGNLLAAACASIGRDGQPAPSRTADSSSRPDDAAAATVTTATSCADTPVFLSASTGSGARLYLYGTLHMGSPADPGLPPQVSRALDRADAVAIEIDSDRRWDALVDGFVPYVRLPDGLTLDQLLGAQRVQQVRDYFRIDNAGWQTLSVMQPWWFAHFGFVTDDDRRAGLTRRYSVEKVLLERARSRGKPVIELETADEQISAVAGGSLSEQLAQFDSWFEAVREHGGISRALHAAWLSGNVAALQRIKSQAWGGGEHLPSLHGRAFGQRDARITTRLLAALASGQSVFAALGVFHLVGDDGVPARLAQAGLRLRGGRLRRLMFDFAG